VNVCYVFICNGFLLPHANFLKRGFVHAAHGEELRYKITGGGRKITFVKKLDVSFLTLTSTAFPLTSRRTRACVYTL
jgi:hypothetical protein